MLTMLRKEESQLKIDVRSFVEYKKARWPFSYKHKQHEEILNGLVDFTRATCLDDLSEHSVNEYCRTLRVPSGRIFVESSLREFKGFCKIKRKCWAMYRLK